MENSSEMCKFINQDVLNKISLQSSRIKMSARQSVEVQFNGNEDFEKICSADFINYITKKEIKSTGNHDLHRNIDPLKLNEDNSHYLVENLTSCHLLTDSVTNPYKSNLNQSSAGRFSNNTSFPNVEKMFADKTTYCRPVLNYYNQELIAKTLNRNARLRKIIKKLLMFRNMERKNVIWKNFINELKNKHNMLHSTSLTIDDSYETTFLEQQSKLCENLLQNFYDSQHQYNFSFNNRQLLNDHKSKMYNNVKCSHYGKELFCYPNSSQGKFMMLQKDKRKKLNLNYWDSHVSSNNLHNRCNKVLFGDGSHKIINLLKQSNMKTFGVQTNTKLANDFIKRKDRATCNENEIADESNKVLKKISLLKVQNKLGILINSINNFLEQIKLNEHSSKSNSFCSIKLSEIKEKLCEADTKCSGSILDIRTSHHKKSYHVTTIDDILDEIDEKKAFDDSLQYNKKTSGSVQITFEIPTKDCSTEVKKSFTKPERVIDENIDAFQRNMTIAVNTDPLSFLALLRISTDTIRNLLSYLPNFNYYSLLPIPKPIRRATSYFTCAICGADFRNASELSDHILEHNLGKTRDCCVCLHALEMVRRPAALFRCRYCGHCFTRAYCCDLHQQSCPKNIEKKEDISSNLILLR